METKASYKRPSHWTPNVERKHSFVIKILAKRADSEDGVCKNGASTFAISVSLPISANIRAIEFDSPPKAVVISGENVWQTPLQRTRNSILAPGAVKAKQIRPCRLIERWTSA